MHIEPVKEELSDKVLELGKNIFETFVPGGAPAIKILEALVGIPIQKRRETLILDICEAINMILKKGFSLDQLQQDENFIEFLLQAVRVASITFKEEKRAALKNAICNSVTHPNPPIFEIQQIFLCYIESFTAAHVKILCFLSKPKDWFVNNGKEVPGPRIGGVELTIRDVIIKAYPELQNNSVLVDSVWNDLYSKDLLEGDKRMLDARAPMPSHRNSMDTLLPRMDVLSCHATYLGKQFVTFISG